MALFSRNKTKDETPDGSTPLERLSGQGGRDDRDAPRGDGRPAGDDRDPRAAEHARDGGVGAREEPRRETVTHDRHDDHGRRDEHAKHDRHDRDRHDGATGDRSLRQRQKDEYGGFHLGTAFFGWLVTVGVSVLAVAILGAAGTAIGFATVGDQAGAEQSAGTIGIVGGVLLLIAFALAYFAGGYVAGRMGRFDGAKQGIGVWVISIVIIIIAGIIGAIAGSQYNVFSSLQLPSIPVSGSSLTTGGVIALVALAVVTILAAILGGKAGQRFHTKVDRV